MSSFFTLPASQRKRKREDRVAAPGSKKRSVAANGASDETSAHRKSQRDDESISGSESEDVEGDISESEVSGDESSSESDEGETAAERRLKLAEQYLENLKEQVDEAGFDAADLDRDLIAERLKEDVDEAKGRVFRQIASQLDFAGATHTFFRADTLSTTSVAVHPPYVYTVSKDRVLIKWELVTPLEYNDTKANGINGSTEAPRIHRKKPKNLKYVKGLQKVPGSKDRQGHTGRILTVAVSPSGKYVATGGEDKKLIIWDAETLTPMKSFTQHRDAVSGLSFTRHISSNTSGEQLFSGSFDRTIKTWSLSACGHAYVETLFGHQDNVSAVASMMTDQCVSVGARDRSARLWKVVDETQLVFRGESSKKDEYQNNSIDCVAVIPPQHFVTGSDAGALSLWSIHKKKPLYTIPMAHGLDPVPPPEELSPETDGETAAHNARFLRPTPRWITALATVPGTDIVLSGSWDGFIRAWRVSEDKKMLHPLGPVGVGNKFSPPTPSHQLNQSLNSTINGKSNTSQSTDFHPAAAATATSTTESEPEPLLKGVVNDIAVFERRPDFPSKSASSSAGKKLPSNAREKKGLCIVAALGKEHRFGRWNCFAKSQYHGPSSQGRNGAVVFEVDFRE